jgi:hypothetical protein
LRPGNRATGQHWKETKSSEVQPLSPWKTLNAMLAENPRPPSTEKTSSRQCVNRGNLPHSGSRAIYLGTFWESPLGEIPCGGGKPHTANLDSMCGY